MFIPDFIWTHENMDCMGKYMEFNHRRDVLGIFRIFVPQKKYIKSLGGFPKYTIKSLVYTLDVRHNLQTDKIRGRVSEVDISCK